VPFFISFVLTLPPLSLRDFLIGYLQLINKTSI
jgi:hypothetical protein